MKFSAPFYEFQEELYDLLTKADEMDFQVFDSAMTVNEISEQLKNLSEVKFGVIADVSAAPHLLQGRCHNLGHERKNRVIL